MHQNALQNNTKNKQTRKHNMKIIQVRIPEEEFKSISQAIEEFNRKLR